jgi:hypothetical protein
MPHPTSWRSVLILSSHLRLKRNYHTKMTFSLPTSQRDARICPIWPCVHVPSIMVFTRHGARWGSHRNLSTVEPGYKDIGVCDTSSIASDILWYQINSSLWTITLYSLSRTTPAYNDRK